ncbi:MAG: hydrogenase maturation nickel metallochaperone HypA, partial [Nitrospirota bacterium]|nr:hydrogenase maturation nickel metallochaperone HypA [Nitrospirota bacterium]
TRGTSLEGVMLEVEETPLTGKCKDCGEEFSMDGPLAYCVKCKGSSVEIVAGRDIDIVSIEPYGASYTD